MVILLLLLVMWLHYLQSCGCLVHDQYFIYILMYIHTYLCTYIHTYVHTYILMYIHTYLCTYIHTYGHTYIHTYVHIYIYTYVHTYIHTSIHCTYIYPYIVHTYNINVVPWILYIIHGLYAAMRSKLLKPIHTYIISSHLLLDNEYGTIVSSYISKQSAILLGLVILSDMTGSSCSTS
jgi:hypothetical protein